MKDVVFLLLFVLLVVLSFATIHGMDRMQGGKS
jgi:hypothetical protein